MLDLTIILPAPADETDRLEHGLVALTQAINQLIPDAVAHGCLGGEFGYGAQYENAVFAMRPFYWGDCDCGYEAREAAWSAQNKHSDSCYQTGLDAAPMDKYRHQINEAIKKRNKHRNCSSVAHKRAQNEVDRLCAIERKHQQAIYKALCKKHGIPWNEGRGCAVHCDCGHRERFGGWVADNGHTDQCALVLPNFLHKKTGLEVRWYKWIGRDMEVETPEGIDLQAVFSECLESLIGGTVSNPLPNAGTTDTTESEA